MAKRCGITIICHHMSLGLPPLDDKRRIMTIICLCVPSDNDDDANKSMVGNGNDQKSLKRRMIRIPQEEWREREILTVTHH